MTCAPPLQTAANAAFVEELISATLSLDPKPLARLPSTSPDDCASDAEAASAGAAKVAKDEEKVVDMTHTQSLSTTVVSSDILPSDCPISEVTILCALTV